MARNRAEAVARDATSELAEANDAAQELEDQLQQATLARREAERLRQDAVDELAEATAAVHTLTSDLTAAVGERDELQTRADEQTRELAAAREQLLAETAGPRRQPSAPTASAPAPNGRSDSWKPG